MAANAFHIVPGVAEITLDVAIRLRCPPHFHDTYAVGIFRDAAATFCRDRRWPIAPGQIVIHHPREVHWGDAQGQCVQDFFYVAPTLLVERFGSPEPVVFPVPVVDDPALAAALVEGLHAGAFGEPDKLRSAIWRLFAAHGEASSGDAVSYAQRHLIGEEENALYMPVARLSAVAGLSRSHFSRVFRRMMGMSPQDFKRQARVMAARGLIESGVALAQSAADAGFADQAHMTRQFRSILGVTPKAVKKAAKPLS